MTITDVRVPAQRQPTHDDTATPESARVAELREMIRSGRYAGYLAELKAELAKAKAEKEIRRLTATSMLDA